LRPIELLVISPSERLDEIALRHASHLPTTVKQLLRVLGSSTPAGAGQSGAFISYLLFESVYTQELMDLGRRDARAKAMAVREFFGWV
jgi:NTE family protein